MALPNDFADANRMDVGHLFKAIKWHTFYPSMFSGWRKEVKRRRVLRARTLCRLEELWPKEQQKHHLTILLHWFLMVQHHPWYTELLNRWRIWISGQKGQGVVLVVLQNSRDLKTVSAWAQTVWLSNFLSSKSSLTSTVSWLPQAGVSTMSVRLKATTTCQTERRWISAWAFPMAINLAYLVAWQVIGVSCLRRCFWTDLLSMNKSHIIFTCFSQSYIVFLRDIGCALQVLTLQVFFVGGGLEESLWLWEQCSRELFQVQVLQI